MAFLSSFYPLPVVAGTTQGTFAEGDDERIVGAAQKASNLSDLESASTARTNLQLGDSATKNVGTGSNQVSAGNHAHSDATQSVAGFLSASDKTKIDGIASGAEVNVQSDWTATTGDAAILNKPSTFTPSSHSHELDELDASGIAAGKVLKSDGVDGASWQDDEGGVPTSRTITAGTGLSGGGDLSANRTISASFGTTAGTVAEGNDSRIVGALPAATAGSGSVLASGSSTSRTLSNRFAERVNVKDFGAVGDGTANDQPAIQAAITAAAAGSIIYFPKGTYFLAESTGLTANKSLSFLGEKNSSTILLNKLVTIGINITGGTIFDFYNLNFLYNQGWYDSERTRHQGAIECVGGINQNGEVRIFNCNFKNIGAGFYGGGFNYLLVDSCEFIYQYGIAGCSWVITSEFPSVAVLASANITKVINCYFNGLIDPTFTGVLGNPPDKYKTPLDGFYFPGGQSPLYQEISNNTVLNHGIEGIIISSMSPDRSYFEDVSLNKSVTSLTAVNSSDATYTKIVTATVPNHGYKIGETVRILGANGNFRDEYNGFHIIQSVEQNTFTYYTQSVPSSPATGTITANVNTAKEKGMAFVKNNYISGADLKSEYYYDTQPAIVATNTVGDCEISGNIINGSHEAIKLTRTTFGYPEGVIKFKPIIKNNHCENVLKGVFVEHQTQVGTVIEGNTIKTSYRFAKNQINDPRYVPEYCFQMPIVFFNGEAIIRNNTIVQEEPLWDAILTVTSRNSGTNSFTVTDGTLVSDNLRDLDFGNNQDYGVLIAYTTNKIEVFPVTSIDENDLIVDVSFFVNQTAFSTGTMYWAKSTVGGNWVRNSFVFIAGGANSELSIENNKIVNPQNDIVVGAGTGPVRCFGNIFSNAKRYLTSGITRIGYEIRDNEILYFNQTGTAAPSSTPKFVGQIFVNTSANIIYMAAGTSSSSDWQAIATWTP